MTGSVQVIDTGLAEVPDDGSPRAALKAAAEFVRAAVHRSPVPFGDDDGWRFSSDAYDCIAELVALGARMAPLLGRLDVAVQAEQEARRLGVAYGSPYDADPAALVRTSTAALTAASAPAAQLVDRLSAAQAALGDAVHVDPPVVPALRVVQDRD